MPVSVKIGGAWKTATNVYNKVGGVWKTATDMPVKVGGVWKTGVLIQGAYESIATATGNGASSITFSSIPSTYKSLQIRLIAQTNLGISTNRVLLRFNGDTGNNYRYHYLTGNGSSVSSGSTGVAVSSIDYAGTLTGTSYAPSPSIIDIIDYSSTTKNKVTRSFNGADGNIASASFTINLTSGLWMNTSAITSITLIDNSNNGFTSNSKFALYGIKG